MRQFCSGKGYNKFARISNILKHKGAQIFKLENAEFRVEECKNMCGVRIV